MKILQIFKSNFKHLQRLQAAFYKADEKDNYIVKHTDKNGSHSQKIINANDVNPTNANRDEMYALNLKENNKASFEDTVLKAS